MFRDKIGNAPREILAIETRTSKDEVAVIVVVVVAMADVIVLWCSSTVNYPVSDPEIAPWQWKLIRRTVGRLLLGLIRGESDFRKKTKKTTGNTR